MQLWIVGRFYSNDDAAPHGARTRWGWGGVFDTKEAAVAACETENDFIAPCVLNYNSVPDSEPLVGQQYPLNPRGSEPA